MGDLILPPGVEPGLAAEIAGGRGVVVNETDLPDYEVMSYLDENARVLGMNGGTTLTTYGNGGGSLLTRSKYRAPCSVTEEICLARELAERDDDVAETIGSMLAVAFGEGFEHVHKDETVIAVFDEIACEGKTDLAMLEVYRELLIASQVTTATVFTNKPLQFIPEGADRQRTRRIHVPLVGVLPAEQIRVLGNDMFGTGQLGFMPATSSQETWLDEFFSNSTSAARKSEMRKADPLLAAMLIGRREVPIMTQEATSWGDTKDPPRGNYVYLLNPAMCARTTFPKGAGRYPRPLLTRSFPLLEAKRLLDIMDYALLESGANFLVIVKKGTDQKPATGPEVDNLREMVKRASRSGVMVGDHRLNVEIITPQLTELLNPQKRKLLGRKIARGLLRLPDFGDERGAAEAIAADVELIQKVITSDRDIHVKGHFERNVYDETVKRNTSLVRPAKLWFPKIILQGTDGFTDLILKLRDRGDIPRQYAVKAAGIDYEAAVAARKREKANGDDKVLTPPPVPFSAPGAGPNDNGGGRPPGGSSANGAPGSAPPRTTNDPARPKQTITRNAGETVRAFDEEAGFVRAGELTYAILEQYADTAADGRITKLERDALTLIAEGKYDPFLNGPLAIIPVNVDEELGEEVRAVRLAPGLSMLVSVRYDNAIMARALCFRRPEFRPVEAHETALRWGFDVEPVKEN